MQSNIKKQLLELIVWEEVQALILQPLSAILLCMGIADSAAGYGIIMLGYGLKR
jgi:hypothetical protein